MQQWGSAGPGFGANPEPCLSSTSDRALNPKFKTLKLTAGAQEKENLFRGDKRESLRKKWGGGGGG